MILWWIRNLNDFEVSSTFELGLDTSPLPDARISGNSLERIQQYVDIEQEQKAVPAGRPPASWPTSGELVVQGLSARYAQVGVTAP